LSLRSSPSPSADRFNAALEDTVHVFRFSRRAAMLEARLKEYEDTRDPEWTYLLRQIEVFRGGMPLSDYPNPGRIFFSSV
ncbi:hypothetical protein ACSTJP_00270, partial [Vibrio parahaemolyticus]